MALLESAMVPLGSACPDFSLPGVAGRTWSKADFRSPLLLVVVMCNHCPYVQAVEGRINALAQAYAGRCDVVGISANDGDAYPEDAFEQMQSRSLAQGFSFPYLFDATQEVARAFGAVCTPDFFLFDAQRNLAYRGRLDDNWQSPAEVRREELKEAMEALLAGRPVSVVQNPSRGCSIKWRKV